VDAGADDDPLPDPVAESRAMLLDERETLLVRSDRPSTALRIMAFRIPPQDVLLGCVAIFFAGQSTVGVTRLRAVLV